MTNIDVVKKFSTLKEALLMTVVPKGSIDFKEMLFKFKSNEHCDKHDIQQISTIPVKIKTIVIENGNLSVERSKLC